jgi:hypothetical protein
MKCADTEEECQCPCCVHLKEVCFLYRLVRRIPAADCGAVHDQILVPFLKTFSALIPSLFPLEWVDNLPASPPRPQTSERDSLRGEYHEMCVLVSNWKKEFSSSSRSGDCGDDDDDNCQRFFDVSGLLCSLKCKGESLLCWLAARRRWLVVEKRVRLHNHHHQFTNNNNNNNNNNDEFVSVSVLVFRMRMQAKMADGIDVVYSRVYAEVVAVLGFTRAPLSTDAMCQFARDVGAVDRMRELAIAFRHKFTASATTTTKTQQSPRVARYMSELVVSLDHLQQDETDRLIAVAMSLHSRLGDRSSLACISGDVLPLCVHRTVCAPLRGLRDVLLLGKSKIRLAE